MANTSGFMEKVFIPKASANGNEVQATVLRSDPDTASAVGQAQCLPSSGKNGRSTSDL
jgi:hypothetical protein